MQDMGARTGVAPEAGSPSKEAGSHQDQRQQLPLRNGAPRGPQKGGEGKRGRASHGVDGGGMAEAARRRMGGLLGLSPGFVRGGRRPGHCHRICSWSWRGGRIERVGAWGELSRPSRLDRIVALFFRTTAIWPETGWGGFPQCTLGEVGGAWGALKIGETGVFLALTPCTPPSLQDLTALQPPPRESRTTTRDR